MTQTLNVLASVTSSPTDVSLKINNTSINMARDSGGAWAGKATLDLPDSVPIGFRAVGIADAPWTLEIKFETAAPNNNVVKDFKHDDKIPASLLSIFNDTMNLNNQEKI
jgi:hypothetical protein